MIIKRLEIVENACYNNSIIFNWSFLPVFSVDICRLTLYEGNCMDIKKIMALASAAALAAASSGCGSNESKSKAPREQSTLFMDVINASDTTQSTEEQNTGTSASSTTAAASTAPAATKHVSPVEKISAVCSTQFNVDTVIQREDGSNTIKIPLAEFIEEGDEISSFTFVIYPGDGASNIGTFKGGCGISVTEDCSAATDKGWYQSKDFSAATEGAYGEITWDVPQEIRSSISAGGDVMFGYWWGNVTSLRIESAVCTYTRTREVPVDGTVSKDVGATVDHDAADNTVKIPTAGFLPKNAVPEVVEYKISAGGDLKKFTGAFAYESSAGRYQSPDTAVFTGDSSLSLTWFVPDEAKNCVAEDGALVLGYWWSKQQTVKVDSVTVKYSQGDGKAAVTATKPAAEKTTEKAADPGKQPDTKAAEAKSGSFRSAAQIISDIKVGWNLGNTLECYDYKDWTTNAEIAWGNPSTTKDMIKSVKSAGFNAVRIPVTWGEHMNGSTIDESWLGRVKEVVDYAYNEDLFVILNMHHDDYIWFRPNDGDYASCSEKLKSIWTQISSKFGSYGDRLLFEGMNEPRTVGSSAEWNGGTAAERSVINKYEQDFVDTVRKSGGNNAKRTLIVTTYAASAETAALNDAVVPKGDNIAISVHYYAPWKFVNGTDKSFGDSQKNELSAKFKELKSKFSDKGVPVIVGEFGCFAAADESTRSQYYQYYVSEAKKNGIKCFVWDNGNFKGDDSYGLFHRSELSWENGILSGIMNGAK